MKRLIALALGISVFAAGCSTAAAAPASNAVAATPPPAQAVVAAVATPAPTPVVAIPAPIPTPDLGASADEVLALVGAWEDGISALVDTIPTKYSNANYKALQRVVKSQSRLTAKSITELEKVTPATCAFEVHDAGLAYLKASKAETDVTTRVLKSFKKADEAKEDKAIAKADKAGDAFVAAYAASTCEG
jgi:hypothetical protein